MNTGSGFVTAAGAPGADILGVGTSPRMLLEATALSRQGRDVTLLEERSAAGGAWHTVNLWEIPRVEMACHLIEKHPDGYAYIEESLGLELPPMTPQPLMIHVVGASATALRLDRDRLVRSVEKAGLVIRMGKLRKVPRSFRTIGEQAYLFFSGPYRYPVGGCRALVDRLVEQALEAGVRIHFGCAISRVEFDGAAEGGRCTTARGPVEFRRLLLSPGAGVGRLFCKDQEVPMRVRTFHHRHAFLEVEGVQAPDFTYIELKGDPLLRRVSEVGRYIPEPHRPPPGRALVCAQVLSEVVDPPDERMLVDRLFQHLRELALTPPDSTLRRASLVRYRTHSIDDGARLAERFPTILQWIETADLGRQMAGWRRREGARRNA